MREILVLGGTGKTGRRVVTRLREAGRPVRAAARRAGDVRFDWNDHATWDRALKDVGAVYLVVPDEAPDVEGFVRRAVAAGTERFVVLSGRGLELYGGAGMTAAEQAVKGADAEWTILRPNNFDQNFSEDFLYEPVLKGEVALPIGDEPDPFVDAEDIADVAAALLTEGGHPGETLDLSGPRPLSFREGTELIAKETGRPVRYVERSREEFLAEHAANAEAAEYLAMILDVVRQGQVASVTDGVERVLGRPPRTFEEYVRRAAGAGAW